MKLILSVKRSFVESGKKKRDYLVLSMERGVGMAGDVFGIGGPQWIGAVDGSKPPILRES